jgi:hypothetical protein
LHIVIFLVAYSAISPLFGTFFVRWLMIILPGLAILMGWGISHISNPNRHNWQRVGIGIFAAVAILFGALTAWQMGHNLIHDVRISAWQWVQEQVPVGSKLAIDAYTLPTGAPLSTRYRVSRIRTADHPPSYYIEQGFDYLLTADDIYDRWQADPEAHPTIARGYWRLYEEFDEIARFQGTILHIPPKIEVRVFDVSDDPVYPGGTTVFGGGWWDVELAPSSGIAFRWMTERGEIIYNQTQASNRTQVLSFDAYVFRDKEDISVYVNGQQVERLALEPPRQLYHVEVPLHLKSGLNTIELVSERGCARPIVFNPESRDQRCISIKVANLSLQAPAE